MKRYEKCNLTEKEAIELLSKHKAWSVQEISGSTVRIDVDGRLFEIGMAFWSELKEAE